MCCKFLFAILLFWSGALFGSAQAKFSNDAWQSIAPIYDSILAHPFNQELAKGALSPEVFSYYKAQDAFFLVDYTKALSVLASKLDDKSDVENVLKLALESNSEAGEEIAPGEKKTAAPAPATLFYTSYLLATSAYKSKEELSAALLPCFWIYLRLADDLRKVPIRSKNPYRIWIETYSSEKYRRSVAIMVGLADKLASRAPAATRIKMQDAFVLASRMEWSFWDGAYRMEKRKLEL